MAKPTEFELLIVAAVEQLAQFGRIDDETAQRLTEIKEGEDKENRNLDVAKEEKNLDDKAEKAQNVAKKPAPSRSGGK